MNKMVSPYVMPGLKYRHSVKPNRASMENIVNLICWYFEYDKTRLYKKYRGRKGHYVRHWCIYFMCKNKIEYRNILRHLGLISNSTVTRCLQKLNGELKSNYANDFKTDYQQLVKLFQSDK